MGGLSELGNPRSFLRITCTLEFDSVHKIAVITLPDTNGSLRLLLAT
jgi:hypothetical protein